MGAFLIGTRSVEVHYSLKLTIFQSRLSKTISDLHHKASKQVYVQERSMSPWSSSHHQHRPCSPSLFSKTFAKNSAPASILFLLRTRKPMVKLKLLTKLSFPISPYMNIVEGMVLDKTRRWNSNFTLKPL